MTVFELVLAGSFLLIFLFAVFTWALTAARWTFSRFNPKTKEFHSAYEPPRPIGPPLRRQNRRERAFGLPRTMNRRPTHSLWRD